jgi:hypothetical protein
VVGCASEIVVVIVNELGGGGRCGGFLRAPKAPRFFWDHFFGPYVRSSIIRKDGRAKALYKEGVTKNDATTGRFPL